MRRISAAIWFIAILGLGQSINHTAHSGWFTREPPLEEVMSKLVAEMRSKLPMGTDGFTLVAIDYQANRLRAKLIVEGYIPSIFIELARVQALKVCTTKTAGWIFAHGIIYDYLYWI